MMDLNTREIATCIWLAVFLIFLVLKARESLLQLLRACIQWAILKVVILMMAYVAVCVALLAWRDLWTLSNLKTTIVWIIAAGFGGLFQASKIDEDAHFFRKALKGTFAFTVIVEFLIGAYTFSLWVELLLIPFLVFLTLLATVGKSQPGSARVVVLIEWLLAIIGLWLLGHAIYEAATHFRQLATAEQARELVVPIMLSLMYLPFLSALNIYMVYERIFIMLQFGIEDAGIRRYAKRSVLISFRSDIDLLKRWRRLVNVERPGSRSAVRETIREIQETRKRQRNPVAVDPGDGWAPMAAIRFLEADGFINEDYHRTFIGWISSSNYVKLDGSASLDTIVYRVSGSQDAAHALELKLHVGNVERAVTGDECFGDLCGKLILAAIGAENVAALGSQLGETGEFEAEAAGYRISLKQESWANQMRTYERQLTIRPPNTPKTR